MSEITEVKVSYKTITVKKGGDWWTFKTNRRSNSDRLELELKNDRLTAWDGRDGSITAFVWLNGYDRNELRQTLIKARHEGHNVVVDK